MKRWQKWTLLLVGMPLCLLVGGGLFVYYALYRPLPVHSPQLFVVHSGVGANALWYQWQRKGWVPCVPCAELSIEISGWIPRIREGVYQVNPGDAILDVLQRIDRGISVQQSITFPEGWTFEEIRSRIADRSTIVGELPRQPIGVADALGIPYPTPEGWIFPDTYFYSVGDTSESILKRGYTKMHGILDVAWGARVANLPYTTPYEALIVASLIEKEAVHDEERPIIASVIVNRLQMNMPLQIDPTVAYGLGRSWAGHLTRADLKTDTPYNTYVHRGLPPTPIAMPGLPSLQAALHPANTPYVYYVARGNGYHTFSEHYCDQQKAVAAYRILERAAFPVQMMGPYPLCPLHLYTAKNLFRVGL